ncbi:MAG: sulfatase-like hydrolase/transferase [Flavobacteriales bacterium]|nr:sulfatase-like hydrolase/transferase [Flavobacteriales bacterium]
MKRFPLTRFIAYNVLSILFIWVFLFVYRWITWRWLYYDSTQEVGNDLYQSFYLGAKFDMRLAVFLLVPNVILSGVLNKRFFSATAWRKFALSYTSFVFVFVNLFYAFDVGNYMYLKERMNATVLRFADNPLISAQMLWESYPIGWISLGVFFLTFIQFIGVRKIYELSVKVESHGAKWVKATATMAVIVSFVFAGYGKLSFYPLRWSEAYFSKNNDLSQLTLNPVLYFVNSLKFNSTTFDQKETEKYYPTVANFLGVQDPKNLNFSRRFTPYKDSISEPKNVVVVMMESLGAQPLGIFGNPLKGSPFIDSLATNSWFLDNFYVPRYGTARTVYGSITGLPDVVETKTASRNPKAVDQRIVLDQLQGLEKLYFLGGSANWANIRALFTNNIDGIQIYEEGSYEQEDRVDVWGINDGDLFRNADKTFKKLHEQNKPFIAYVQTSGYHPPYTVPDTEGSYKRLTTDDISEEQVQKAGFTSLDQYNSLRYFDHNLKVLFDQAKKSGYYEDTVFVLFGDHNGRISPYYFMEKPEMETGLGQLHVPLIIHGAMIPKRVDHRMANLLDVYPTVADLLSQSYTNYTLGRSLLRRPDNDPSPTFAFEAYQGKMSPVLILPEHFYWSDKSGDNIAPIYKYTKEGFDKPDTSFDAEYLKQLDSLSKGLYQSTLYLYFNNKK